MPRRPAGPRPHDLFDLFPDLPWPSARTGADREARMQRLLLDSRDRATRNIERQRAAAIKVRERVAERQAAMFERRPSLARRRRP